MARDYLFARLRDRRPAVSRWWGERCATSGAVLMLVGILLLALPGQGLLTLLVGS